MIKIVDKKDCCGCSACVQRCPKQCINLHEDNEGFLYPEVNENFCIDCGVCERVCPVLQQNEGRIPIKTYAAINADAAVRMQSSSGGIFTLFAEKVINDGGVVFGARFDEQWEVCHDYTDSLDGLSVFRGSKYLQSRMENNYAKAEYFLKLGRQVLFTGTPCQILGLKKFLRKEYENLLTIDIICHGVPSPGIWRKYLSETVLHSSLNSKSSISDIEFRNKTLHGWKKYSFILKLSNETAEEMTLSDIHYNNAFMKAFLGDLILRPSCYSCPAKSGKSGSDITIADYWGIQNVLPEFDDDGGVSAVLVNTIKGQDALACLDLDKRASSYDNIIKYNKSIIESAQLTKFREHFMEALFSEQKVSDISIFLTNKMKPSLLKRAAAKLIRILSK